MIESMLWVGWFGFNGGSALYAGQGAAMAILVTHISAPQHLSYMVIEWRRFGRPLVGMVTGMVAGLATVTPASGFIGVPGGIILGLAGGYICYVAVDLIRGKLKIDDPLMSLLSTVLAVSLAHCLSLCLLQRRSLALALVKVFLLHHSWVSKQWPLSSPSYGQPWQVTSSLK